MIRNLNSILQLSAFILVTASPSTSFAENVCQYDEQTLQSKILFEAQNFSHKFANNPDRIPFRYSGESCAWTCDKDLGQTPATQSLSKLLYLDQYNCANSSKEMGFGVSDIHYRRESSAKFKGEMMTIPPSLVEALKGTPSVTSIENLAEQNHWKYLLYNSTSVFNEPDGYSRILILIEGKKFDRWIQLATVSDRSVLGRNVDYIGLQKVDEKTGETLPLPLIHFQGYSRRPHGLDQKGGGLAGGNFTHCYSCHSSGLRQIHPALGSYSKAHESSLESMNKIIATSFPGAFGSHYIPALDGPAMGPLLKSVPGRLDMISQGCGSHLSLTQRKVLANAMSCSQCHNGHFQGAINSGTDFRTIDNRIHDRAKMPMPPYAVSQAVRNVLPSCLREEYAGLLKDWILKTNAH